LSCLKIILKSVFIIALASVAIIGMMVPSVFAEKELFTFEERENTWENGGFGSGTSIFLIVNGELQDNGFVKIITEGVFPRSSMTMTTEQLMSFSAGTIEKQIASNDGMKEGEEYTITVKNGDYTASLKWIPLPLSTISPETNETAPITYSEITSSKIIISGETKPVVKQGMVSVFPYQVEITGELEFNPSVNHNGGWLERCHDNPIDSSGSNRCATSDKVFLISETSTIFEFEEDLGYFWKLHDQFRGLDYDPKPKVIEIMFRFGDDVSSFNIYPDWKNVQNDYTVSDEQLSKINTKSVQLIDYFEARQTDRWFATMKICSGTQDLQKPSIIVHSDLESTYHTLNKSINALSCAQQEVQVKAIDPETIYFEIDTPEIGNDAEINQLRNELEELKEMIKEEQSVTAVEEQSVTAVEEQSVTAVEEQSVTAVEDNGGGCLIATATYGSEMSTEVQQLRELRDNQLLQTVSGTQFMSTFNDIYYSFSPIIADYERENLLFKEIVKIAITPMISSLSLMENADSESEVISLGLSVIVLNIGMYLGIPAIVVVGIRKRI